MNFSPHYGSTTSRDLFHDILCRLPISSQMLLFPLFAGFFPVSTPSFPPDTSSPPSSWGHAVVYFLPFPISPSGWRTYSLFRLIDFPTPASWDPWSSLSPLLIPFRIADFVRPTGTYLSAERRPSFPKKHLCRLDVFPALPVSFLSKPPVQRPAQRKEDLPVNVVPLRRKLSCNFILDAVRAYPAPPEAELFLGCAQKTSLRRC